MAVEPLGSPCRAARRLTHYGGADPQDFSLEGRLGSGDWVTLYDTTGFDFASVGEKKQFDIPRVAVTAAAWCDSDSPSRPGLLSVHPFCLSLRLSFSLGGSPGKRRRCAATLPGTAAAISARS